MDRTKKTLNVFAFVALIAFSSGDCRAGIVIEFESATLNPNEVGEIDIFIRSDSGTDAIALFDFELSIINEAGDGIPAFFNPQASTETAEARYVFGSESGGFSSNVESRNSLIQSDSHSAFSDITLPTDVGDRLLLGRIELFHELPASEVDNFAGATFEIALIQGVSTVFSDANFEEVTVADVSFSNRGFVTVSAIPEPSCLPALGGLLVVFARRRKRLS